MIIDESFHQNPHSYELIRIYHTDGHVLRVKIHRDFYGFQSYARVEVLTPARTWTVLATQPWTEWHQASPPNPTGPTPLTPIADRLVERARRILTPPTAAAPADRTNG